MIKSKRRQPKPKWLRSRAPGGERYLFVKNRIKTLDLHTVCESAQCPNVGECWGGGTATIMIMGDVCTRGCRFCAVKTGNPGGVLDEGEPERVARAIKDLELNYVVLTSVDRDDLADGGAAHFAATVRAIKAENPGVRVEVLIPDFADEEEALRLLLDSQPDVVAHNIEVVRRLTPKVRDRRATYERSLSVLKRVKQLDPDKLTKSSIMVGTGETDEELYESMRDLRAARVDIVTVGQYLSPSDRHLAVDRYFTPELFEACDAYARSIGFSYTACGPLVRSSYRAGELFIKGILETRSAD